MLSSGVMCKRSWFVILAGVSCAVGVLGIPQRSAGAPRQMSQVEATPATKRTGTLIVQVVLDGTGSAVKEARVTVVSFPLPPPASTKPSAIDRQSAGSNSEGPFPRDVVTATHGVERSGMTDRSGTVQFDKLPGGFYSVAATPPSGLARAGLASSTQCELREGNQVKVVVALTRGAVISGRLFDEEGDPVTGASIQVLRQKAIVGGSRTSGNYGAQPTNDLGQFRVWGLAAGDYLVSATWNVTPSADGPTPREGNLPTFFPGVAAVSAARPVTVRAGQESGGIDFPLVRGRLGAVVVRVTDSSGILTTPSSAPFSNVMLSSIGGNQNAHFSGGGASYRADGSFLISNVPPGDYYVSAMITRPNVSNGLREGAYLPVSVNGDEVTVDLQTNLGASISGRVVVERRAAAGQTRPAILRVAPVISGGAFVTGYAAQQSVPVRPDGTFELSGLRGPVQLTVVGGQGALKSAFRGATDIGGIPLELRGTERIDGIVITLTEETGTIDCQVTDEHGEAVPGALFVVFPDDSSRLWPSSPFVRSGTGPRPITGSNAPASAAGALAALPKPPGGFTLRNVAPGRYAAIALPPDVGFQPDRELLLRLRELATSVVVVAGQTTTAQLRLVQ